MNRIVLFFVLIFLLSGCGVSQDPPIEPSADRINLNWVQVKPPPGVAGPCYAYFISDHSADNRRGYAYSGVWCK